MKLTNRFRKIDKRIEELVHTEREYVKSLNYIVKVRLQSRIFKKDKKDEKPLAASREKLKPRPARLFLFLKPQAAFRFLSAFFLLKKPYK